MRAWVQRFFYGRNGMDQLSIAIFILGTILAVVARATDLVGFLPLYYVCMLLFFYRTLSRNIYKRQSENLWFTTKLYKIRSWFRLRGRMLRETRDYKYLKCPDCHQRLRVPRGKGKINITCSRCRHQFQRKV